MNKVLFQILQVIVGIFLGCISFILFFYLGNKNSEFMYKLFHRELGGLINTLYILLLFICLPLFIFLKTKFKTFSVIYFSVCILAFILLYWFSSVWTPKF